MWVFWGVVASTQKPGCKGLAYSEDDLSPPDLFLGVIECLGKGRGERAAGMAILMLARAAFDTRRVTDQTAHDAGQVLMLQLRQSVLPEKRQLLDAQMKRMTAPGSPEFEKTCIQLVFAGPPTHSPGYMISHGIKAITGDGGPPLVEPFDARAAWDAVRKEYLHCPY